VSDQKERLRVAQLEQLKSRIAAQRGARARARRPAFWGRRKPQIDGVEADPATAT
jgi:hypothetical protein